MKRLFKLVPVLAGFLTVVGCGGGASETTTETTSTTRALTGNVDGGTASVSALKALANTACLADTVIATDTAAATTTADVAEDCSFSVDLATGKSYAISFLLNGEFVASLIFDSGISGFSGSSLPISDGDTAIDLGTVTFSGSTAIPEIEPLDQIDCDDDGIFDSDDDDDDGDDVSDDEEEDCDLDGVSDDWDESEDDDACTTDLGDVAQVYEVKPRNDPNPEEGEAFVDLDKEVRARIGCLVDTSTVTDTTFQVASESDTIACTFEFSDEGDSHRKIKCKHEDQDFQASTLYTITLDGIQCEDGRGVESRSWSFMTTDEDTSDGDVEDDIDEEDELEDESDDSDSSDDEEDDDESDDDEEDTDEDSEEI